MGELVLEFEFVGLVVRVLVDGTLEFMGDLAFKLMGLGVLELVGRSLE